MWTIIRMMSTIRMMWTTWTNHHHEDHKDEEDWLIGSTGESLTGYPGLGLLDSSLILPLFYETEQYG